MASLPVAGKSIAGGISAIRRASPPPQEPTTNAHDWVWLGRATLERASGMLVPAAINNNSHRAMRITTNPSYSPPHPVIDSSTYCKDRPRKPADNHWNL